MNKGPSKYYSRQGLARHVLPRSRTLAVWLPSAVYRFCCVVKSAMTKPRGNFLYFQERYLQVLLQLSSRIFMLKAKSHSHSHARLTMGFWDGQ